MNALAHGRRRVVALLPMKAHSARVPAKNFRRMLDKPLFQWVLDTLLAIPEIDEIVINTDARDILAQHNCVDSDRIRIRDRREELRGDYTSMNLIIEDDIAQVPADVYVMTHTTNPLLSAKTIRAALSAYEAGWKEGAADSLFSVTRIQTRFYTSDGLPVNHDPLDLIRTQDLPTWFEENSNLYVFSGKSFHESGARIGRKPALFESPKIESIDIDDEETWVLAESIARGRRAND